MTRFSVLPNYDCAVNSSVRRHFGLALAHIMHAIMQMRSPKESFRVEPRRVESRMVEINLENDGELALSSRLAIEVRWSREGGARLLAGDGLRGFELVDAGTSTVKFQTEAQSFRLPAGERQLIGWLRFSEDREVQVEIVKSAKSVKWVTG